MRPPQNALRWQLRITTRQRERFFVEHVQDIKSFLAARLAAARVRSFRVVPSFHASGTRTTCASPECGSSGSLFRTRQSTAP